MCGRFVSSSGPGELAEYFDATLPTYELEPSYNVAPTNEVYAVKEEAGHRTLAVHRWGLVPFWAKDLKIGSRLINARSESAPSKPAFRAAYKRRRCLIPLDGFYEWHKVDGIKRKQPYLITSTDGDPLVAAGLWESWVDPESPGTGILSCTILTCDANESMSKIHNRMPVLVPFSRWDLWLDPATELTELTPIMRPAPNSQIKMVAITDRVNNVRNNGSENLLPATKDELIDPNAATIAGGLSGD